MAYNKENEPQEKKKEFEEPKIVDTEGKKVTDEELEDVSGGLQGNNTCSNGSG